jgi:predicted site-specific integrase-resolvase
MDYDDLEITSREACEILGITRATLSSWKGQGKGPAYETLQAVSETSRAHRYRYRLKAVLDFMASRGASRTEIEAARRKALTRHRLRLARAADKERVKANLAIRSARRAREAAALAGHKPSIAIFERGDF